MDNALPNLTFQNPTFAVMPPRDRTVWFVGEREGRLIRVRNDPRTTRKTVVLDLRAHTLGWQDVGLLNMAFHPRFGVPGSPDRGYLYLWYNHTDRPHRGPGHPFHGHDSWTRLSRFTLADGATAIDPRSELVLIDQHRTNTDHMGGGMLFHPGDGFLYLGTGDGGTNYVQQGARFALEATQDPQHIDGDLLSGVLRIDVDRRGGGVSHPPRRQPRHGHTQGYFIPDSNPWVTPGGAALEEFFAIGFRNPHRMTYDPGSDRIFVGEVGNVRADEIDLLRRGGNYGWNVKEGRDTTHHASFPMLLGREETPLYAGRNGSFSAIIGGHVYRGRSFPSLQGQYLFGNNGTGQIWLLDPSHPDRPLELLRLPGEMRAYGGLSSFAVDGDGEIYLCILGDNQRATGTLRKLVALPPSPVPPTLSATHLFRSLSPLVPRPELFAYQVNAPFWSDHALKTRWLSVPAGRRVTFRPRGEWSFPPGTVAVKHFELPSDERSPERRLPLETRVLLLDGQGRASGHTYRWRPDGSDADVVESAVTEALTVDAHTPWKPLTVVALGNGPPGRLEPRGGGAQISNPGEGALFAYQVEEGEFDLAARWSLVEGGPAGFMFRDSSNTGASQVSVAWEPADPGGAPAKVLLEQVGLTGERRLTPVGPVAGRWLRVSYRRGRLEAFVGEDGHHWISLGQFPPGLKPRLAGLFAGPRARATVPTMVRCLVKEHHFPDSGECAACHLERAGSLLGVTTRQWNRDIETAPGQSVNQLVLARERGLLDRQFTSAELRRLPRLFALDARSEPLETRVRSYLDANCAQCHRPGVVVQVGFDARFDTPLFHQGLIMGRKRWPSVPRPWDFMVLPGAPERSEIFKRVAAHSMPPLGSVGVDREAVSVLRSWIGGLGPPPGPTVAPEGVQRAASSLHRRMAGRQAVRQTATHSALAAHHEERKDQE